MKKILFAAQNLQIGGIQKAMVNLLEKLSEETQNDITLFTFAGGPLERELPENIKIESGGRLLRLSATSLEQIKKDGSKADLVLRIAITVFAKLFGTDCFYRLCFKKTNTSYDIAVSYFNDATAGVFNKGTNYYVSEFVDAAVKEAYIHTDPILSGFDHAYCRKIYQPFDRIVCVSEAVRQKFCAFLPEYAAKTETRHNVFNAEKIKALSVAYDPFEKNAFDIVTVARVDNASKRIDGIVRVCAKLKEKGISGFRWHIVGNGPDLTADAALAETLGVSDTVIFEGEKENPYPYIRKADLFALYSAYEGFPIVVGEALLLQKPILTTPYAAAHEQIPEGSGLIADSDEDFCRKLAQLVQAKPLSMSEMACRNTPMVGRTEET